MLLTFPRLSGVTDADAFVTRLFAEHGVAVAPGRFFGAPAHIRVGLGGRTESLSQGLEKMERALAASAW